MHSAVCGTAPATKGLLNIICFNPQLCYHLCILITLHEHHYKLPLFLKNFFLCSTFLSFMYEISRQDLNREHFHYILSTRPFVTVQRFGGGPNIVLSSLYTVYTVHCTLYTVHQMNGTQYNVHCTLYIVHCTLGELYTVKCTLYTVLLYSAAFRRAKHFTHSKGK